MQHVALEVAGRWLASYVEGDLESRTRQSGAEFKHPECADEVRGKRVRTSVDAGRNDPAANHVNASFNLCLGLSFSDSKTITSL